MLGPKLTLTRDTSAAVPFDEIPALHGFPVPRITPYHIRSRFCIVAKSGRRCRFGSKADIGSPPGNVRFVPKADMTLRLARMGGIGASAAKRRSQISGIDSLARREGCCRTNLFLSSNPRASGESASEAARRIHHRSRGAVEVGFDIAKGGTGIHASVPTGPAIGGRGCGRWRFNRHITRESRPARSKDETGPG